MDMFVNTPGPAADTFDIPLDLIDDSPTDGRSVRPTPAADRAMAISLEITGQLQNIGVNPPNAAGHYPMAFGARRLRAARLNGWTTIRALVKNWSTAEVAAIRAAENMQRVALDPIDQWLAVQELMDGGASLAAAAAHMGLTERETRRMQRLAQLHPDMMALVRVKMPSDQQLRVIALTAMDRQAKAVTGVAHDETIRWWEIVQRCEVTRIDRTVAIFDTDKHPSMWDEDLFAQPDDPDRFSTSNTSQFIELQTEALKDRVAADRALKRRVQMVEPGTGGYPILPTGWRLVSACFGQQIPTKPSRTESIFTCVTAEGAIAECLAENLDAKKAKASVEPDEDAEAPGSTDDGDDDADGPAIPAAAEPDNSGITKAGLDLIAAEKTRALHGAIGRIDTIEDALIALVLAFAADNIEVRGMSRSVAQQAAAMLLRPGGHLAEFTYDTLISAAETILTGALRVSGPGSNQYGNPGSGDAAEWVGVLTGAEGFLGRFDTPEFLATVKGPPLRAAAMQLPPMAVGDKASVAQIRAAIAGQLPEYRPAAAAFGAPRPTRFDGGNDE